MEFLKTPDTKALSFWNKQLKPFLKKNYPTIKNDIFITNADLEYIISEIDKINNYNNPEKKIIDEIKLKFNEKNSLINENKNSNINMKKTKNENINSNSNNNDLRPHSETLASTSTADSFLNEKQNNLINIIKEKEDKNNNNLIDNNINLINENNKIEENSINNSQNEKNKSLLINYNNIKKEIVKKSKSELIKKEITPTFIDLDEITSKNIIFQSSQK